VRVRALVLASCLLLTAWYLSHASTAEAVPAHEPITSLPLGFDDWVGQNSTPFSPQVLAVLGADSYIMRLYRRPNNHEPVVGLYVGFYESQRQGETMHSPLNCMPGAGWLPTSKATASISAFDGALRTNRALRVNRVVIQRGLDRQLVLYWYQSHGRIVASEYWGKIYTVVDAVRLNRTDAALVRVLTPIDDEPGSEARAEARAVSFVQALFPRLARYLPE